MNARRFVMWILGAALAVGQVALAQQTQTDATLAAASDGKGSVRLIWQPPYGEAPWAAQGYTLDRLDAAGRAVTLARGLRPGDDLSAMARIQPAQAGAIRKLVAQNTEAAAGRDVESFRGLLKILTLASIADFRFAQAMGLAYEDSPTGAGPFTYRLTGPTGAIVGTSQPVDLRVVSPLESAPTDLTAEATPLGVQLSWTRPSTEDVPPVLAFRVRRDDGSGFKDLGDGPVLYRSDEKEGGTAKSLFTDDQAPAEQPVRYTVVGLDIFGRETPQAEPVSLFVPDFDAAAPPKNLKAEVKGATVVLSWEPKQNPRTRGYLLEKSAFSEGPYTSLSEKPLSLTTTGFTDTSTFPGQRVFYRIASLDSRGKADASSVPVGVVCRAAGPPSPPSDLEATLGMNSVTLRWKAGEGRLLGYQVQKAGENSEFWSPASSRITPEPRFDDPIDLGQSGVVRYRVIAIGSDNQASAPSAVLSVPLPDNNPPSRPRITAYDGAGGAVTLSFVPGAPEADTSGFLVLRGAPGQPRMGVITDQPLPASARSFRDDQVVPDREYVYQVVAVDPAQNHSEPSNTVTVGVGEPVLTAPPAPAAAFEAKPFPRVRLSFAAPTPVVAVVVERQEGGDAQWVRVAGPLPPGATEALDPRPPRAGRPLYRIYYQTLAGAPGPPSAAVEVDIPAR
jgi:hypothetical protein